MNSIKVPVPQKIVKQLSIHGDTRQDDFYWMRERDSKQVLDHLQAENEYYEAKTAHTLELQQSLFDEMRARIKEDDVSVPYKYNGYWYLTRFVTGKNYPVYARKKENLSAVEEVLFDNNLMAQGHSYFNQSGYTISEDNTWAAYGVDTVSRRQYVMRFKNLVTQEDLPDTIVNTSGRAIWAADSKTVFYTRNDEETLRSYQVFMHVLGTDPKDDKLVYEEKDETFSVHIYKTKSRDFIVIASESTLTSEYRCASAHKADFEFHLIQERVKGLEYTIEHFEDYFYIITNKDNATNFKLMKTSVRQTASQYWEDVIAHRDDVLIEDIEIFRDFLVVEERINGLNQIRITRWASGETYYIPFDSQTYTAFCSINPDFNTTKLRYVYNALTTPTTVVEFDMASKIKVVLKEKEVLGNFSKDNYESQRIWATAEDGTKVPISLVYRKGLSRDSSNPVLLYAYGSYGHTTDPSFSTTRLSLLDRGFIFAIAHVRGGEYLGRAWYEQGKLLNKRNTFTDFISCSRHLIAEKYTSAAHLYAYGGSAGGLLMGAIINMAPQLYHGVIAAVPFVDVVTTMLDESIPLTTGEYDEWGDPNDKKYYDYMKSYSPYDQVVANNFPNILVTTGYHDSQVQYWEPAKWVAKLRENNTGEHQILFHTNMEAGHGGASGRFEALKETAKDYAFILNLEAKAV